jgi:ATP phosphoribosyltransferase
MTKALTIAVPSKGRLEEKSAEIFTQAGMTLKRAGARGYTGTLVGFEEVEIAYLSASEIAARLRDGSVHFGITGEDLLREEVPDLDSIVQLVMPLGFGHADVVVAIPNSWVDVATMADLAEVASDFRLNNGQLMRVATKYIHLATDYFAANDVQDIQIVTSFGATEGAPASGAAEAIVDITSTGATLAANNLRVPEDGVILKSQANLAAALKADWSPQARAAAKQILARLSAYRQAMERLVVSFVIDAKDAALFDNFGLDGSRRMAGQNETYLDLVIEKSDLQQVQDILSPRQIGMTVSKPAFVFSPRNELFERLAGAIL